MSHPDYTLYSKTPTVMVLDNRGQTVRDIHYYRHPDTPQTTDKRITRHQFNALGQRIQSIDPRLFELQQTDATVKPNFAYFHALTGEVLRTDSVDAGSNVSLDDIANRPVLNVNATNVIRTWQYEDSTLPGRLLSITEQPEDGASRITERFVWAGNSPSEQAQNLAGTYTRHYDTAGLNLTNSISLTNVPLSVSRQLLKDDVNADWQGNDESAWNALLSPEVFTTMTTTDATGMLLTQTDAKGNRQRMAYDVAGLLRGSWLTLKGQTEQVILKSQTYSAAGQKLREEHGNGLVTTYRYEVETQRLIGIKTERPAGHAAGAKVLLDLRYDYDPVGNVLSVGNDAEATRFWRNQKVDATNTYTYDSLYQLVVATGRELANIGQQNTSLPHPVIPLPTDNSSYTHYTRNYIYDEGGNLTQIRHSAPISNNNYTTDITVSNRSNRAVLNTLTKDPAQVDTLFDQGGHQLQLLPGQPLIWTGRGELQQVTPVSRGDQSDKETYRYDADSQRIVKVSTQQTGSGSQMQQVIYLPGLELRTTQSGSTLKEALHTITVGEAGRTQVRVLHWENGQPDGINNDQIRYSYDNLIGSSNLEVNSAGMVISQEEYYPYGGTSVWTAKNQTEADYKTIRYSGKERDATGLYYYGYRYYQSWTGRWLSADPAGTVDGLNLFRMVRNNPITWEDSDGRMPKRKREPEFENIEGVEFRLILSKKRSTVEVKDDKGYLVSGDRTVKDLKTSALLLPEELFEKVPGSSDNITQFRLKEAIPESCISATEYIIDRLHGRDRPFNYAAEAQGEETSDKVSIQPEFKTHTGGHFSFNASDDDFAANEGGQLPLNSKQIRDIDDTPVPNIGEGLMLAETSGNKQFKGSYPFHFMAVLGTIVGQDQQRKAAIISDVSEPTRDEGAELPRVGNLALRIISSNSEVRDHDYTVERYRLGRVVAQPRAAS
ncbi:RHS repeat-associated core domain-containing protein [Xenorhabdus bovienii]|uniref:RHS repeat-associated core domain-containing protein n=1 Tax=Xenorhabdus bovienii TaxID=40576 RepID=UPI003DA5A8B1